MPLIVRVIAQTLVSSRRHIHIVADMINASTMVCVVILPRFVIAEQFFGVGETGQ